MKKYERSFTIFLSVKHEIYMYILVKTVTLKVLSHENF